MRFWWIAAIGVVLALVFKNNSGAANTSSASLLTASYGSGGPFAGLTSQRGIFGTGTGLTGTSNDADVATSCFSRNACILEQTFGSPIAG